MATGQVWTDDGQEEAINLIDLNTRSGVAATFYGAWGSSNQTPAVTDAALVSENPESRTEILAANMSQPAADIVRWVYVIVATSTRTVQETGVLTLSSSGILWVRIVHGSLALEAGDQVTYTVNLQLKDTSE